MATHNLRPSLRTYSKRKARGEQSPPEKRQRLEGRESPSVLELPLESTCSSDVVQRSTNSTTERNRSARSFRQEHSADCSRLQGDIRINRDRKAPEKLTLSPVLVESPFTSRTEAERFIVPIPNYLVSPNPQTGSDISSDPVGREYRSPPSSPPSTYAPFVKSHIPHLLSTSPDSECSITLSSGTNTDTSRPRRRLTLKPSFHFNRQHMPRISSTPATRDLRPPPSTNSSITEVNTPRLPSISQTVPLSAVSPVPKTDAPQQSALKQRFFSIFKMSSNKSVKSAVAQDGQPSDNAVVQTQVDSSPDSFVAADNAVFEVQGPHQSRPRDNTAATDANGAMLAHMATQGFGIAASAVTSLPGLIADTAIGTSTSSVPAVPVVPSKLTQTTLACGLALITCNRCKLQYNTAIEADRKHHKKYHDNFVYGFAIEPGRFTTHARVRKVNVTIDPQGDESYTVVVTNESSKYWKDLAADVLRVHVDTDLGCIHIASVDLWVLIRDPIDPNSATNGHMVDRFTVILQVEPVRIDGFGPAVARVVGALLAERICVLDVVQIHNELVRSTDTGKMTEDEAVMAGVYEVVRYDPDPSQTVHMGVSKIWVHSLQRRKKIAFKMVETARKSLIHWIEVAPDEIAFSPPTKDGTGFAVWYNHRGELPDGDYFMFLEYDKL